jgi:hypothetical protein
MEGTINKLWVAAIALVCLMAVASGAAAAESASSGAVLLRTGHMGRYSWSAALELPEGLGERKAGRVCPVLTMVEPTAAGGWEGQSSASCAPPPTEQPTVEYLSGGYGGTVRSALEVLFPPEVQQVELKLQGSPMRVLRAGHTKLGDPEFGRSIPLAFVVQGLTGRVCIEQLSGKDSTGAVVSKLGRRPCR